MQQDNRTESEELRLLLAEEIRLELEHANLVEFRKQCKSDQIAELAALVKREARYVSDRADLQARIARLVSKKNVAATDYRSPKVQPPD